VVLKYQNTVKTQFHGLDETHEELWTSVAQKC